MLEARKSVVGTLAKAKRLIHLQPRQRSEADNGGRIHETLALHRVDRALAASQAYPSSPVPPKLENEV